MGITNRRDDDGKLRHTLSRRLILLSSPFSPPAVLPAPFQPPNIRFNKRGSTKGSAAIVVVATRTVGARRNFNERRAGRNKNRVNCTLISKYTFLSPSCSSGRRGKRASSCPPRGGRVRFEKKKETLAREVFGESFDFAPGFVRRLFGQDLI